MIALTLFPVWLIWVAAVAYIVATEDPATAALVLVFLGPPIVGWAWVAVGTVVDWWRERRR